LNPCIQIVARKLHSAEYIPFGKLLSQGCGKACARARVKEEVQLVGVTHSGFVDGLATDDPHIRYLRFVVV
jgi:hypothetical protein